MKKKIIFILLTLLMLGTIAFFYVHNILLPVKVKEFIKLHAEEYLNRSIEIENIDFKSFEGFRLTNVKIYKKGSKDDLLFYADQIRFNILLTALFKQKTVIIPSLYIEKPSLHLIRLADQSFNTADIFRPEAPIKKRGGFTMILRKIIINTGELDYTDQTQEEEFFESFQNIHLIAQLSLDSSIQYELSSILPLKGASLAAKGEASVLSKSLKTSLSFQKLPLSDYLSLLNQDTTIAFKTLLASSPLLKLDFQKNSLMLQGDLEVSSADVQSDQWRYHGAFALKQLHLFLKDNSLSFKGNILSPQGELRWHDNSLKGNFNIRLDALEWQREKSYLKGDARILKARLSHKDLLLITGDLNTEQIVMTKDAKLASSWKLLRLANGEISSKEKSLKGQFTINRGNMIIMPNDVSVDTAFIIADADIRLDQEKNMQGRIEATSFQGRFKDQTLFMDGKFLFTDTRVAFSPSYRFSGHPKLDLKLTYPLLKDNPPSYQGIFQLTNAAMQGLPYVDRAAKIKGDIQIFTGKLTTERVTFDALDTSFAAKGRLENLNNPLLDIQLAANQIDLKVLQTLIPVIEEKFNVVPSGLATVNAQYKGHLKPLSLSNAAFASKLLNAQLDLKKIEKSLININGEIKYQKDQLSWQDLNFLFNDRLFALSGNYNLADHVIETYLETDDLKAQTKLTYLDERFHIDAIKGRYATTTFEGTGFFNLKKEMNIDAKGSTDIKDIDKLPQAIYQQLRKANPLGRLKWQGSFVGFLDQWQKAKINLTARTNTMRLIHYPLNDVQITYHQEGGSINQLNMNALVYEGSLNIQADGDLLTEGIPFKSLTKFIAMDLSAYRKDKKTKNRFLSGKLSCAFTMNGLLLKPETYEGVGKLAITEAYLGQLVPQINEAIYKEADADFIIRNKKVYTDNGMIRSDSMDLLAQGWVDFDKRINFEFIPSLKLKDGQKIDTGKIKIDPAPLLSNAVSIKMTGTLDNPVKEVNTSPANVIKNTTGVIKEGLKGVGSILEDLF